jgi:hypothetical protein
MISILPALILLILQGPAALELDAARQASAPYAAKMLLGQGCGRTDLNGLLMLSKNPPLAEALVAIITLAETAPEPELRKPLRTEPQAADPPDAPRVLGIAREGFADSSRSRDGPLA